jgi:hypothetical protein
MAQSGPPADWMSPWPASTTRIWPFSWLCQNVRAHGVKLTVLIVTPSVDGIVK